MAPVRFINPNPITVEGIKTHNPQLFHIYLGKKQLTYKFTAVAGKDETLGTALGSIFKKAHKLDQDAQWIGKVGNARNVFRSDPGSRQQRKKTKKEINLDVILEKLAYDLFQELGRGFFCVPKTRLAMLPIRDEHNVNHWVANDYLQRGIADSLRIMSRFVKDYSDLQNVTTRDGNEVIGFMDYIVKYKRPPDQVLTSGDKQVPIKGMMELLAVGRCLADVDLLGGGGGNAGIQWIYSGSEITHTQAVKIDPGFAFQFTHDDPHNGGMNCVINTHQKLGHFKYHLLDLKDIQTSTSNHEAFLHWSALTQNQQDIFLATLLNAARYIDSDEVLDLLFYRNDKFNFYPTAEPDSQEDIARIPHRKARRFIDDMKAWISWQLDIYAEPLAAFKQAHPEQLLRIRYIDDFGELPLPLTEETYPIRQLFTKLRIVEHRDEQPVAHLQLESSTIAHSREALSHEETASYSQHEYSGRIERVVKIDQLFDGKRKVLLLGVAGIGKSTLCQHISHSWASGIEHQQFTCVYWIALRDLNHAVKEGGFLHDTASASELIAKSMAHTRLSADLENGILQQLAQDRSTSLVVLDGYDEASEVLRAAIQPILDDPELHILVSSRPGIAEHLQFDLTVENIGFSKEHISSYCKNFFSRNQLQDTQSSAFISALHSQTILNNVVHIPIVLQMLAGLWEQGQRNFASSKTKLYSKMIDQLCGMRWLKKPGNQDRVLRFLSLLGRIALPMLADNHLVISQDQVRTFLSNSEFTEEDLIDSGIVKSIGCTENRHYQFLHLSYQEYLTAYYVSQQPGKEQTVFILEKRNKIRYRSMLTFLAGHIYSSDPDNIQIFFVNLCNENFLCKGEELLKLILLCFNECVGYRHSIPAISNFLEDHHYCSARSLVHSTAFMGQLNTLRWLLIQHPEFVTTSQDHTSNLIHTAAFGGQVEIMKFLVNQNEQLLITQAGNGSTCMHAAAAGGCCATIEWIYNQKKALAWQARPDGWTPMHSATFCGNIKAMEWFCHLDISHAVKVLNFGSTYAGVYGQNNAALETLLSADNPMAPTPLSDGWTPMHAAAYGGSIEAMVFISNIDEALISKPMTNGWTPLHIAAYSGHVPAMEWLVAKNPRLAHQRTAKGFMILGIARTNNRIAAVEWISKQFPEMQDQSLCVIS